MGEPSAPHGVDSDGNCSNCGSSDHALGSPYDDENSDQELQDMYCENCGSVLRTNQYSE